MLFLYQYFIKRQVAKAQMQLVLFFAYHKILNLSALLKKSASTEADAQKTQTKST